MFHSRFLRQQRYCQLCGSCQFPETPELWSLGASLGVQNWTLIITERDWNQGLFEIPQPRLISADLTLKA